MTTQEELDRRSGGRFPLSSPDRGVLPADLVSRTTPGFAIGDTVRVRERHPPGHTRAPRYAQGKHGTIVRIDAAANVSDIEAHGGGFVVDPLYSVRFTSRELWGEAGADGDFVHIDAVREISGGGVMADHHHPEDLAPVEARIAAIEAVLVEKGVLDVDAVDQIVAHFEDNLGPMNGARVIARAWTDPEYRTRLLTDGTAAIAELGFSGPEGDHMVVVENTAGRAQSRRLHVLLVLPVADARAATEVVQGARLPFACGAGAAQAARRDGHRDRRRRRGPGLGFQCGGAVPGAADAARWHRRFIRGATRGHRHARLDDRGAAAVTATPFDDESLPRDNGELVFDAPWQARALAIAVAVVERLGLPWDAFRHRLMASIAEDPNRPYYESWTKALESLVVAEDLATATALDEAMPIERAPL